MGRAVRIGSGELELVANVAGRAEAGGAPGPADPPHQRQGARPVADAREPAVVGDAEEHEEVVALGRTWVADVRYSYGLAPVKGQADNSPRFPVETVEETPGAHLASGRLCVRPVRAASEEATRGHAGQTACLSARLPQV